MTLTIYVGIVTRGLISWHCTRNRNSLCALKPRGRLNATNRIFNPLPSGEIILRPRCGRGSPVKRIIGDIGAHRDKQTAAYDGPLPRERGTAKPILFIFGFGHSSPPPSPFSLPLVSPFRREDPYSFYERRILFQKGGGGEK